jgi:hypothetical protein
MGSALSRSAEENNNIKKQTSLSSPPTEVTAYKLFLVGTLDSGRTTLLRSLERFSFTPASLTLTTCLTPFFCKYVCVNRYRVDGPSQLCDEGSQQTQYETLFRLSMASIKCLLAMTHNNGMLMATWIRHCPPIPSLLSPHSAPSSSASPTLLACDHAKNIERSDKELVLSWCYHCPPTIGGVNYESEMKQRLAMTRTIPELIDHAKQLQLDPSLQLFYLAIDLIPDWHNAWNYPFAPHIMEIIDNEYSSIDHNKLKQLLLNISPSHQQQHEHHSNNVTAPSSVLMVSPTTSTILLEPLCDIIISYLDPPNMYPLTYMIYRLWNNSVIQRIWKYRHLFHHMDNTQYLLNRIHLIGRKPLPVPSSTTKAEVMTSSLSSTLPPTPSSSTATVSSFSSSTKPSSLFPWLTEWDLIMANSHTTGIVERDMHIDRRHPLIPHVGANTPTLTPIGSFLPSTISTNNSSSTMNDHMNHQTKKGDVGKQLSLSSSTTTSNTFHDIKGGDSLGALQHLYPLKLIDLGGGRSERKKWIHCYDNLDAWYGTLGAY